MDEEDLGRGARRPATQQPGLAHLGRIENEQIARRYQGEQRIERVVAELWRAGRRRAHHQQPTGAADRRRRLGDQLGREVVIEIGGTHRLGEQTALAGWRHDPEPLVGIRRRHPAPGGSLEKPLLEQVRFIDLFERAAVLADGRA